MRYFSLAIAICLHFGVFAQLKQFKMEEVTKPALAPKNLRQAQFIHGTSDYVHLVKEGESDVWMKGNINATKEEALLNLESLNAMLKGAGLAEQKSMPAIQFGASADWVMTIDGAKISLNPSTKQIKALVPKAIAEKENVEESSAGFIAYVDKHNLFVHNMANGKVKRVTKDGSADLVYAGSVHQNEFGISKGTFWSNNGKKLAFYRMDQSMIKDYPIVDWTTRPATNKNLKYPMAGEPSHHVTLGVHDAERGKTIYLKTGEPKEQYLTNVAWTPDDRYIIIAVVNRAQSHAKWNLYDAKNGAFVRTMFEEKHDKYVEPLEPAMFMNGDINNFVYQSRKDGWNHLYSQNLKGENEVQLTKGKWEVLEVKGHDKSNNIYFIATEESPVTKNLYKLDWKTKAVSKLTESGYVHNVTLNSEKTHFLDSYSSIDNPRTVEIKEIGGGGKVLLKAENPVKDYALGELSVFSIKGKSGDELYCRMYKPTDFDPSKKYPVIVYWYGGPHAQMITKGWNGGSGDYLFQYFAQRGYLVFSLDTRGSAYRGREFEQSIFRKAGDAQMEDLLSGVDYLKTLSYANTEKMGLYGWSYGGFLTTNFMLTHPDVFDVAVAGGPVIDWKFYEIMYTERYMDTPQENAAGFEATDLTKRVDKLKGKLMLIHGMQDNVVVLQHSVNFVKACVDKSVQVDYMIYPGHEHNVRGKDRAHLYQKMADYLMGNTK